MSGCGAHGRLSQAFPHPEGLGNLRSSLTSLVITLQWGDLERWCWGGWVAGARRRGPPKRPREAAVTVLSLTRWRGRPAGEQGRGRLAVPGKVMIYCQEPLPGSPAPNLSADLAPAAVTRTLPSPRHSPFPGAPSLSFPGRCRPRLRPPIPGPSQWPLTWSVCLEGADPPGSRQRAQLGAPLSPQEQGGQSTWSACV